MTKHFLYAVLLLALAASGGCNDSPSTSFLDPTGTVPQPPPPPPTGSISGQLLFPGDTTPPYPVAAVYAVLGANAACTSAFSSIHITGNYTTPEWTTDHWTGTPGMTQVIGCVWFETVPLTAKELAWKFVVNRNWDPSYGTSTGVAGFQGETELVSGTGTDLHATVTLSGDYTFILNEGATPATYQIMPRSQAPIDSSDAATRAFLIDDLPNGTYTVAIVAPGYPTRRVAGVQVTGENTDIGTVSMTGAITGRVLYEGNPEPRPIATIEAMEAGETQILATAQSDSAFSIVGLTTGAYDLRVSAAGYRDTTVTNVAFTEGSETDVGDVFMRREGAGSITGTVAFQGIGQAPYPVATIYAFDSVSAACASAYATVHVTGNHSGWTNGHWETTPGMTPITNCIWIDTIHIDPETLNDYGPGVLGWKFILDKQWDPSYGRPPGAPASLGGRTELVTGTGTELQATLDAAGDWVFILNETGKPDDVRYRLALVEDAPLGFSDETTRAFEVDQLDPGTYEIIVTAPGYLTARLHGVQLSGNTLDIDEVPLVTARR